MANPCCFLCRGPHGICLNQTCEHHIKVEKQDEANHQARQTYRDPTSRQAVNNVMAARRRTTPKRPFNYPKEER